MNHATQVERRAAESVLRDELNRCLDADPASADRDEQEYLIRRLPSDWRSSLVIFGACALGLRALHGLRSQGIVPLAIADNDRGKWGTELGGLPVIAPDTMLRKFGRRCSIVVCVWRSDPVMNGLRALGFDNVVEFKALFWHLPEVFLPNMRVDKPSRILRESPTVRAAFDVLSDEQSKREFVQQLGWLLAYRFGELPALDWRKQYFESLYAISRGEIFVDCGAYSGDTLQQFLEYCPQPEAMHAFEPDPTNLKALRLWQESQTLEMRRKVHIHACAASDRSKVLRFTSDGVGSAASDSGEIEVQAVAIDEELAGVPISLVKMDIEGGEPEAIEGATGSIAQFRPVITVCLYHRQEHLFSIPHRLSQIAPDYSFYIRRYGDQFGDIVCYAVPHERRLDEI